MTVMLRVGYALLALAAIWALLAYLVLPMLWRHREHRPGLEDIPKVTRTSDGVPGDPLNVALIGSEAELGAAMKAAGWRSAAALGVRADVAIAESVLLDEPDPNAPVSSLYLFGRKQDLAFEQEAGASAKQRNHVRFWRAPELGDAGRPLWLGSATFDRGVGLSHLTGQITHHIAPDIDRERDRLMADLDAAYQLTTRFQVTGIGPTLDGRNGGGDRYFTDGEIDVGVIAPGNAAQTAPAAVLADPPAVVLKNLLWAQLRPLLR